MSAAVAATGRQLPTESEAYSFVTKVRDALLNEEQKYEEFLLVLKDFENKRIYTTDVVERVEMLFAGHQDLLLGFNTFLPERYYTAYENRYNRERSVKDPLENHRDMRQRITVKLDKHQIKKKDFEKFSNKVKVLSPKNPEICDVVKYLPNTCMLNPLINTRSVSYWSNENKAMESFCTYNLHHATGRNCHTSEDRKKLSNERKVKVAHEEDITHNIAETNPVDCEHDPAINDGLTYLAEERPQSLEEVEEKVKKKRFVTALKETKKKSMKQKVCMQGLHLQAKESRALMFCHLVRRITSLVR